MEFGEPSFTESGVKGNEKLIKKASGVVDLLEYMVDRGNAGGINLQDFLESVEDLKTDVKIEAQKSGETFGSSRAVESLDLIKDSLGSVGLVDHWNKPNPADVLSVDKLKKSLKGLREYFGL